MTLNKPAISSSEISRFLPQKYKNIGIKTYDTTDSTNRVAKELAANGSLLPVLVVSDSQTAGRGRLGRSFYSPAQTGIYMSVAVGGFTSPADALFVTCAAAVAVTDAIISLTGKNPGIKWVNDIFLDDKKICGILAESQSTPLGFSVIVGIGLNMTTKHFPDEISQIAGALLADISREQMIAEITKNLLKLCENPADKTFMERYKRRSILIGKEINYYVCGREGSGTVVDINESGGLIVQTKTGERVALSSGEVSVRLKK